MLGRGNCLFLGWRVLCGKFGWRFESMSWDGMVQLTVRF